MLKKYTSILLLFFVCFTFAGAVNAWDDTGHKVSTYIAWQQMTPEVRAKAIKLLRGAPEDSHLGVYYPAGSRSSSAKELELFMIASTWPDIIRNQDFKVRFDKYHKGPWHYAGILWKQEAVNAVREQAVSDGLAIIKLPDFEKNLKDGSISDAEKAVNLAWFLHVAGDVHNPLHNAARITSVETDGDRGGNRFLLVPEGTKENVLNLHSYWDGILSRGIPRANDACDSDYIAEIAEKTMRKYPFSSLKNRLKLQSYDEWNNEGFRLLNNVVYTNGLKRNELPSKKYQQRAFTTGQEQIALAGYRIAETLNQIFKDS